MVKQSNEIKELINLIPVSDYVKLLIKAASESQYFHNYLLLTYFDKESAEKDIFKKAISDLNALSNKRYKGFSYQLQLSNYLKECSKRINEFKKICKNKKLEADLIVHILDKVCKNASIFGTCFTSFDYRVGLLLNRLCKIVNSELHEDYKIEYSDKIRQYIIVSLGDN